MLEWIAERFSELDWRWELFGLLGEGLFFARLIVQWGASEKARRPVLPLTYWYMSLAGALILVAYALHKGSLVLLLPQFVGIPIYTRQLQLELRHLAREKRRQTVGFDQPGFPWPALSLIVPVHNEEKILAQTLRSLQERAAGYPGHCEIIAAMNGCTDRSAEIARAAGVTVVESATAGISHGRNVGARASTGDVLGFIDADTTLEPHALQQYVEDLHGHDRAILAICGRPDRGGPVVRASFAVANRYTCRKRVSPPGGAAFVRRDLFEAIGGFDETLPQGTNTDFIRRALAAGADYVVSDLPATTSIRRFEKTGIIRQMLAWRRNHRELARGQRRKVETREYEVIR